ncbi:MAG TPA: SDR family oxidoreductase [Kiritimatiellia bacterium]|nr:SDR family oxidoreductase [Kiritimatiellia bacterium]
MDLGLENRRAWLGGSSRGLGLACAHALALEGCEVTLVGRHAAQLAAAAANLGGKESTRTLAVDLGTREGIEAACADVGAWRPDILLLNAGGPPPGTPTELMDGAWADAHQLLLDSARRLCMAALPAMRENRRGRILAITSQVVFEPADRLTLSNVYRTALTAYLKTLAREVAAEGVTVNSVMPGQFLTDRLKSLIADRAQREGITPAAVEETMRRALPQQCFQDPDDLGALVALLASDRGGSITGAAIPVDGGMSRFLLA